MENLIATRIACNCSQVKMQAQLGLSMRELDELEKNIILSLRSEKLTTKEIMTKLHLTSYRYYKLIGKNEKQEKAQVARPTTSPRETKKPKQFSSDDLAMPKDKVLETMVNVNGKWYLRNYKKQLIYSGFSNTSTCVRTVRGDLEIYKIDNETINHEITTDEIFYAVTNITKKVKMNFFNFERLFYLKKTKLNKKKPQVFLSNAKVNDHVKFNNENFRITKYSDSSLGLSQEPFKLTRFVTNKIQPFDFREVLLSYDFETTQFCTTNPSYNLQEIPYLLCVTVNFNQVINMNYEEGEQFTKTFYHLDLTCKSTVVRQFLDWLEYFMDIFRDLIFWRIFGYNNFRFDDNFLLSEFIASRKLKLSKRGRNNKTTSTEIEFKGRIIHISDIVRWIPDMKLSQACEDYEVKESKLDVDIVKYNQYCTKEQVIVEKVDFTTAKTFFSSLSSFLKIKSKKEYVEGQLFKIYDYIAEYCKYDTLSVMELYIKLKKMMEEIFEDYEKYFEVPIASKNFMSYISPSQVSGIFLKNSLEKQKNLKMTVQNNHFGLFIYDSYFGGRVDYSCIGEYIAAKHDIRIKDVRSQYTCAMTSNFPEILSEGDVICGEEIDLSSWQFYIDKTIEERDEHFLAQTLDDFTFFSRLENWRGILLCDIKAPQEYHLCSFASVPKRNDDATKLVYTNESQSNRILNTIHFKNLILSGWKIILKPSQYNIIFKRVGKIFKPFVDFAGKIKVDAREGGNKTKGKLMKNILNSAAGKLAQKVVDTIDTQEVISMSQVYSDSSRCKTFNWSRSLHYLASFITAEANWILFSTFYKMQLDYIYRKEPLSSRCGSVLYMDTDSIMYDHDLVRDLPFELSEEIGVYNDSKCDFDVTWSEKARSLYSIIIVSKKSYYVTKKEGSRPYITKLKGIHSEHMKKLEDLDTIKSILSNNPMTISDISVLERKRVAIPKGHFSEGSNFFYAPYHALYSAMAKKTLTKDSNYFKITPTNLDKLNIKTISNLNQTLYKKIGEKEIFNFIEFCCSILENPESIAADNNTDETNEVSTVPS